MVLNALAYGIGMVASSGINAWSASENRKLNREINQDNRESSQDIARLNREHQEELQYRQLKFSILQQRENQDFQRELAELNHERQREIEQFRAQVNLAINQKNLDFQKWRFEQEKNLQYEILQLQQEFQRELSHLNHQHNLTALRERMRADNSPIKNLACDLLENSFVNGIMPLKVLLSPPSLDYDTKSGKPYQAGYESFLAEEIRQFLHQGYLNSKQYPIQLLDKAWISNSQGGGSALHQLHSQLKSIPILVIDAKMPLNQLNLNCGYWMGNNLPMVDFSIISGLSCQELFYTSAKYQASQWQIVREKLRQMGKDEEYIKAKGGVKEDNFQLWLQELAEKKELEALDISTDDLIVTQEYEITEKDYQAFYEFLAVYHCLTIGFFADTLFLSYSWENIPLLPKLFTYLQNRYQNNCHLTTEFWDEAITKMVNAYQKYYDSLQVNRRCLPEIRLKFAYSLSNLPTQYRYLALQQANQALRDWLQIHELPENKIFDIDDDDDCRVLKEIIYQEDEPFFQSLLILLKQFRTEQQYNSFEAQQIISVLKGWKFLKRWGKIPKLVFIDVEEISIDSQKTVSSNNQNFTQTLSDDVGIEMVYIPAGIFVMGSNESSHRDDRQPIHKVSLQSFYLSKYQITQAQYQVIMGNNPSYFSNQEKAPLNKGVWGDFPVEAVTWDMAIQFCHKLSAKTGRYYQLPTEAQWEYACRAGSESKYCFGNDASQLKDYAWYSDNSDGQTHPVGQKKPNQWGLHDMHGNVWEWCQDYYINNYNDAPKDGSAYKGKGYPTGAIVLRGGSFSTSSYYCLSTTRGRNTEPLNPLNRHVSCLDKGYSHLTYNQQGYTIGFRVMLVV